MQTNQNTPALHVARLHASADPRAFNRQARRDEDFLSLLEAYRATGGLARGAEIAGRPSSAGFLSLAKDIATRRALSFVWRDEIWLPVFQFEAGRQTIRRDVQLIVEELAGILSDWELTHWFVEPNVWLDDDHPLTHISSAFDRVHDAARAFRFTQCI